MNKTYLLGMSALLALCSASSQASPFTFIGDGVGGVVTDIADVYQGSVHVDGYSLAIGKLTFENDTTHTFFSTVCADLFSPVGGGPQPYNVSTTNPVGVTPLDKAGQIVAANFSIATSADQQAGLQMAVWDTIYTGLTYHFGVGSYANAHTYELQYLASIGTPGSATYIQETGPGGQSQLTVAAAPEPATIGVLSAGFIGLLRRRKK